MKRQLLSSPRLMTVCTTENPGGTSNAETEELPATKSPRLADASPVSKPSTGWFQTTPDANALIRSISTPVDKYTGTANIQVPLASIRTNTGNIPVALSYQASGIKVTDRATIVGLGWRLVAGGKITRQVNGFPENGFTKRFSGALDYETFKEYFRNQKSTEPDIYYFEFPGMSGAFVMDENGNPHTIPYQNLDIKFNSYRFEIKDPAGTVYHFTTQERTECGSSEEGKSVSYTSTWYLDAIEYMDGTAVGFGYRTGSGVTLETSERSSKITVFPRGCYEYNPEGENYRVESQEERVQSVTVTEPKFLEYIRYKDTRVEFLYDDSRSDMSWKRLAKVNVTVKEEILKSFRLIHSSFVNCDLKLTEVMETSPSGKTHSLCRFDYYEDERLPIKNTLHYDHWGYFAAQDSAPKIYYPTIVLHGIQIKGHTREPNLRFARTGTIRRITYGTGGYKEFEFELHSGKSKGGAYQNAGGLRIKRIVEKESDAAQPSVTAYSYEGGRIYADIISYTSLLQRNQYNGGINRQGYTYTHDLSSYPCNTISDFTGTSVVYSSIVEIRPDGSYTRDYYTSLDDFPELASEVGSIDPYGNHSQFTDYNGLYPKTQRWWGRNLVKEQRSYSADHKLTGRTVFSYSVDKEPVAEISAHYLFVKNYNTHSYTVSWKGDTKSSILDAEYKWISAPVRLDKVTVYESADTLPSVTEYEYDENYYTLKKVTVNDCENNRYETIIRYPQDFSDYIEVGRDSNSTYSAMRYMLFNGLSGIPVEHVSLKNGKVIEAKLDEYVYQNDAPGKILLKNRYQSMLDTPVASADFVQGFFNRFQDFNFDGSYYPTESVAEYDRENHPLCTRLPNRNPVSMIYGYNLTQPVAKVENAVHTAGGKYVYTDESVTYRTGGEKDESYVPTVDFAQKVVFRFTRLPGTPNGINPVFKLLSRGGSVNKLLLETRLTLPDKITCWLEPGNYEIQVKSEFGNNESEMNLEVKMEMKGLPQLVPERTNEVYHTSFEDLPSDEHTVYCSFAKTGEKVLCGEYDIDLRSFIPGVYTLSYWECAADSSVKKWKQVVKSINITRDTTSYTLKASPSLYMDEVRIMPSTARMTTCTCKPGIGITSRTDINGVSTYYQYDDSGRIYRVLDNDRKVQKEYIYDGLTKYTVKTLSGNGTMLTQEHHLDGLGRPVQTVSIGASPSGKNVVQFKTYDTMGRSDAISYLPYTLSINPFASKRNNPVAEQQEFLKIAGFTNESDWKYGYASKHYDASPEAHVVKQGGPGAAYSIDSPSGHPETFDYRLNTAADRVQRFEVTGDGYLCPAGLWPASTLQVKIKSEPVTLNTVRWIHEYTDCHGQVVATEEKSGDTGKRTYYVYDDLGRVRYVIPPAQSFTEQLAKVYYTPEELGSLCSYFEYDRFGRKVKQYMPGREYELYLYDLRGRLVLSQNGNQRADAPERSKWSFVKYDVFDRPVMSGTITGGTYESHYDTLQEQFVFGESPAPRKMDAKPGTSGATDPDAISVVPYYHGYTDRTYPHLSSKREVTMVNYYDDYGWASEKYDYQSMITGISTTADFSTNEASGIPSEGLETGSVLPIALMYNPEVKGRVTGTKVKVIGIEEDLWLATALYYDRKYGTIQTVSDMYPAGLERVSNKLNRVGQVTYAEVRQTTDAGEAAYHKNFVYDHAGRLLEIKQRIHGDRGTDSVTVAAYRYDERGQVAEKAVHNGAETTVYSYDLQGRMLAALSPSFSFRLNYDDPSQGNVRYDGAITKMQWNRPQEKGKAYSYNYDSSGRLTSAFNFETEKITPEIEPKPACFSVPGITYDKNGNILSIKRTGSKGSVLHDLELSYAGNRLTVVSGAGTTLNFYKYDANGNMTFDAAGGYGIQYNEFNLPEVIFDGQREIRYIYTSDGARLATLREGSGIYYRNTMIYLRHNGEAERLHYIVHPEGIAVPDADGGYTYKYFKRDHTGSVRAVLAARTFDGAAGFTVEQSTDYYPFGLAHSYDNLQSNRILFAGKELQSVAVGAGGMLGLYDFGARFYNPMLGRWLSHDPAGQFLNPYMYCSNSPLTYGDEDGEWIEWLILGVGLLCGYIGGAAANETWNIFRWNWRSYETWFGIFNGMVQGAAAVAFPYGLWKAGTALVHSGSILGKTLGVLSRFVFFGQTISQGLGVLSTVGSYIRNPRLADRILWGNFKYDTSRSIFQGLMRSSWEGFQQNLGYAVSQFRNMIGQVDDVSYFDGVTLVNYNDDSGRQYGFTMGYFVNSKNLTTEYKDFPMFMHEFGHTFQSRKYGFLYMYIVALPSVISCEWIGDKYKHRRRWYEMEANTFSADYFRQYGINWRMDANKGEKRRDQPYPTY